MADKKPTKKSGSKKAARKGQARSRATDDGPPEGVVGEFASSDEVRTGFVRGRSFDAKPVQFAVIDGDAVFEGDIELGPLDQLEQRSAELAAELRGELVSGVVRSDAAFRWPDCRVPYTIDAGLTNQGRVTAAIDHWEANTNYTFALRTSANAAQYPDYVTFRRHATRCSSWVGRQGGQQFINVSDWCQVGNLIHEIGHAVGLWHEQSREDRDAFVTINWDKIQPGREHNFNQHITDGDDVGPYDYGSIMHYPRTAFSVDGSETITPADPSANLGQRTALSPGDIAAAHSLCPPPPKPFKEPVKEPIKERIGETFKEQVKEPIKEPIKESGKERFGETIKERFPETQKEQFPETRKEQFPETRKEHFPETTKERFPETRKEQVPETQKEFVEPTRVEQPQPGFRPGGFTPGGGVGGLGPGAGPMPFGMRPSPNAPGDPVQAGGEDVERLLADLETVNAAFLANEEDRLMLLEQYDHLVMALQHLGWQ